MFFLTIIFRSMGDSDAQVSRKVVDQLVAIFAGSEVATDTAQEVQMPDINIQFVCDELGVSEFSIKEAGINKQVPVTPFFAPGIVSGRRMTTWSLDWSIPFRVTNFVFVTSPKMRYYFIGEDSYGLLKDLPREDMMTREIYSSVSDIPEEGIEDKNNYKVKFILFGEFDVNSIKHNLKNNPEDISAIRFDNGKIYFYKHNGIQFVPDGPERNPEEGVSYLSKTEQYAAIFTQDYISYTCNMKKAFKRLEQVSRVYGLRVNLFKIPGCSYRVAEDILYQKNINNPNKNSMQKLAYECYNNIESCRYSIISGSIDGLHSKNRQLEYGSCPLIY